MNTTLMKQLEQVFGPAVNDRQRLLNNIRNDLAQEDQFPVAGECACGTDPFALLKVALIVKYNAPIREAAFKFVEESEAILKEYGVNSEAPEPTLSQRFDALKAEVGQEVFDKMLANPDVAKIATRVYRRNTESKSGEALDKIAAIFNGAIETEALAFVLSELSQASDPVRLLAEA